MRELNSTENILIIIVLGIAVAGLIYAGLLARQILAEEAAGQLVQIDNYAELRVYRTRYPARPATQVTPAARRTRRTSRSTTTLPNSVRSQFPSACKTSSRVTSDRRSRRTRNPG
jgi:hypothetical protein